MSFQKAETTQSGEYEKYTNRTVGFPFGNTRKINLTSQPTLLGNTRIYWL